MGFAYDKSIEDLNELRAIGVPDNELNGYGVMDAETYILREYYSNRVEDGFSVPEKYLPLGSSAKERLLKAQDGKMHYLESERIDQESIENITQWERMGYDYDELYEHTNEDTKKSEHVPDWLYNLRKEKERAHARHISYCRNEAKRKRNEEISKKLEESIERTKQKRRENEEKSEKLRKEIEKRRSDI